MAGRTSLTVFEGMIGMTENVFINTKNRVAHHHRGSRRSRRAERNGVHPVPGRSASAGGACTSRMESRPIPTTGWACNVTRLHPRPPPVRSWRRSASALLPTVASSVRVAQARSRSATRRSQRARSSELKVISSRPTRGRCGGRCGHAGHRGLFRSRESIRRQDQEGDDRVGMRRRPSFDSGVLHLPPGQRRSARTWKWKHRSSSPDASSSRTCWFHDVNSHVGNEVLLVLRREQFPEPGGQNFSVKKRSVASPVPSLNQEDGERVRGAPHSEVHPQSRGDRDLDLEFV